ncbi:S8 family peptidase [Mycoplasma mycoides]|uniref:S8 family peptidase n=1 Tax=Mycoplasma mycoides TaxID=2102 RepID=UPI00223F97E3|nr:S8 family peptidase [Mycoplasma mycoides]QVJ95990.1 S8 family peptidase [Mycoplasma mycoides subsp. capri]QVJ96883.1 S8 family peptidase [Mycoplasma mycoides subsp. capri]QVK00746.1 S8 family peptidase [Mycoplasma mycoides subsp. capri]
MNEILEIKPKFFYEEFSALGGSIKLPKNSKPVSLDHLLKLKKDLENVYLFWIKKQVSFNPIVSVYYKRIIAKSNRIKGLFKSTLDENNELIVGSRFYDDSEKKQIITYCVSLRDLNKALDNLEQIIEIVKKYFSNGVSYEIIEKINDNKYNKLFEHTKNSISKTRFVSIIVDAYYIETLRVDNYNKEVSNNSIITIYDTKTELKDIFKWLNIDISKMNKIDETTFWATPEIYEIFKFKAPYLIAMSTDDKIYLDYETEKKIKTSIDEEFTIPDPTNEPIIGVIDTLFSNQVYFHKWVEYKEMIDKNIYVYDNDYDHGTAISSIIVDGPRLNPRLDDGCGRFRVKHFGIAPSNYFNSLSLLRVIEEIIISNRNIKVWNLSLGSKFEINENYISIEASILDKLQYQYDVIFVIAGTNKIVNSDVVKIGSPADSINALVVNSVDFKNNPTNYSRTGPVLSFFNKPDVSYYGGTIDEPIYVFTQNNKLEKLGTSFAAPWIARKLAYLIHIIGLSKEVAKALIIDSACSWNTDFDNKHIIGYGVVPIHINDILKTPKDEIKLIVTGVNEKYNTYNNNILIPTYDNKYPFVCKATLCYFVDCSRQQGVDYTNTELSIKFGRIKKDKNNKLQIIDINKNNQDTDQLIYEKEAREWYRKWDNVKHIKEKLFTTKQQKLRPKKVYDNLNWAISIKTKHRINSKNKKQINFGIVITLKEINGVNRIDEFIKLWTSNFHPYIVRRISIENSLKNYQKNFEEINFE